MTWPGDMPPGPQPAEAEAYRILRSRIDLSRLPKHSRDVTERVIYASADFDYATDLVCDEEALATAVAALAGGAAVVADVVAPPMFAVVYSAPAVAPPILDPEVELNFAMMVHGGQEFVWGAPVVAGDEITTTASVKDISEDDGRGYYVFESLSANQRGEEVCRGTWTNIVRGV